MEKIVTPINTKWMDEDGILNIEVIEGAYIDVDALKEDHTANEVLTKGKRTLALYDARNFYTITPDAMEYLNSRILEKERIATAVLTDKLATRLLVNFINKIKKPEIPLKMFSDPEHARKWLLSFRN